MLNWNYEIIDLWNNSFTSNTIINNEISYGFEAMKNLGQRKLLGFSYFFHFPMINSHGKFKF